jgi:serine/threonine protein kinase
VLVNGRDAALRPLGARGALIFGRRFPFHPRPGYRPLLPFMVDVANTAYLDGVPASATTAMALIGQTLGGRYRVTSLIGSGGMGAVYRAEHVQLHKTVALKVLNAEMAAHREAALRFEREALVSARIQHPHVVSATDSGRLADGSLYLVLEYVAGKSLREVVDAEGRMNPARALNICAQIAEALAAAHRAEIVHRDLKPGNVMLSIEEGNPEFVKVLDFGLARLSGEPSHTGEPLTKSGSVFGTPEYMSPEQARGEVVDHRSDLYALGVILFELLSGKAPFSAPELVAVLIKHLQEPPPPLPADVPAQIAEYVALLLEKQPARRPSDALQVAKALRRMAPRPTFSSAPPAPPPVRSEQRGLRQRAAQTVIGLRGAVRRVDFRSVASRSGGVLRRVWGLSVSTVRWFRADKTSASRRAGPPRYVWLFALVALGVAAWAAWPSSNNELNARARQGEPEALGRLAAVPATKRPARASLALASGYLTAGDFSRALDAIAGALDADADMARDPELGRAVRRAVDHEATRERALELAAKRLGPTGVDLLFDVWSATLAKTPATRSARKWLDTPEVRSRASASTALALDLRETKSCLAVLELLPGATRDGDNRSVAPLKRFQSETGCGFLKLEDCYPCLRGDDALDQAVAAAGERPAPSFVPK